MYLSPFFKIIALFFLLIFVFKAFNPKVFPYIGTLFRNIISFFKFTFKLLVSSSIYTVTLLFTKTIFIIGIDILVALLADFIVVTLLYPISDIGVWTRLYLNNLFDFYILSFFITTYVVGLFYYLKVKDNLKMNVFRYFEKEFVSIYKKNTGNYTYDEDNNTYTYHK